MLIYVLDLFDGGGGAEAPKAPPPPLNPTLAILQTARDKDEDRITNMPFNFITIFYLHIDTCNESHV